MLALFALLFLIKCMTKRSMLLLLTVHIPTEFFKRALEGFSLPHHGSLLTVILQKLTPARTHSFFLINLFIHRHSRKTLHLKMPESSYKLKSIIHLCVSLAN